MRHSLVRRLKAKIWGSGGEVHHPPILGLGSGLWLEGLEGLGGELRVRDRVRVKIRVRVRVSQLDGELLHQRQNLARNTGYQLAPYLSGTS